MSQQPVTLALPKQFLITHEEIDPPAGWRSLKVGDRNLYVSPELPVTRLVCTADVAQGNSYLVLGWFALDGTMYPDEEGSTLRTDAPVERLYFDMTGRFLILCHGEDGLHCITDPGGLLSLVIRPDTGEAASTPAALSLTRPVRRSAEIEQSYQRRDPATWFPFGVTPYQDLQRVLPGSKVELSSGEVTRVPGPALESFDPRESVERIHSLARGFVDAVGAGRSIESHLTAGWDSRMVLSACLGSAADTEYVTYKAPGTNGEVDCFVAGRIAQTFSLRHKKVALLPTRQQDVDDWIARTSGCIRDSVMNLSTTVANTDSNRYVLCGVAGEVGRAFYWRRDDIGKRGLGASELLRRLGFVESRQALEAAEQWLHGLSDCATTTILDQAYIDLRLGGWAGPSVYGHPVSKPTLSFFNNARIFSLMRQLPERYRHSGQFAQDFVALGSSSLARMPVNRAAGLDRIRFIKRELSSLIPKRARNSLRALLAS